MMQQFLRTSLQSSKINYSRANSEQRNQLSQQKNRNQESKSNSRNIGQIPQLDLLQKQIMRERPNNIMQFIKKWASKQIQKKADNFQSSDEQIEQESINRELRKIVNRRNGRCQQITEQSLQNKFFQHKTEQIKSIVIVTLRNLQILKTLSTNQLWKLINQSQTCTIPKNKPFIQKGDTINDIIILIQGQVQFYQANSQKVTKVYQSGTSIGQSSIIFPYESSGNFIAKSQVVEVERIRSSYVRQLVKQYNKTMYKKIKRALQKLQIFNFCHKDQIQKVSNIAINSNIIEIRRNQQILRDNKYLFEKHQIGRHQSIPSDCRKFFVVIEGKIGQFDRNIMNNIEKPRRVYQEGEAFGIQVVYGKFLHEITYSGYSQESQMSTIIQIDIQDIQRAIGPLKKVFKRRNMQI